MTQLSLFEHLPVAHSPPVATQVVVVGGAGASSGTPSEDPVAEMISAMSEIVRDTGEASDAIGIVRDALAQCPAADSEPNEPRCLGDDIMEALEELNRRGEEDFQTIRRLHARILGCSIEDLDAVVAKQEAERTPPKQPRGRRTVSAERNPSGLTWDEWRAAASADGTDADRKAWREDVDPSDLRDRNTKIVSARRDLDVQATPPSRPRPTTTKQTTNEPPSAMRRLTERQQELLACMMIENGRATFGPNEQISDWSALKEVMEALGGTYLPGGKGRGGTKRKGSFAFPDGIDAEETLWLARERGEVLDPTLVGAFFSPKILAERVVGKLDLAPGAHVIEPSAGTGSIAKAVLRACPTAIVSCVELLDIHRAELQGAGFVVIGIDFLAMSPSDHGPFDAAAMNPPFDKGAEARHVLHAARFVRPGGMLSSIVSMGVTYRNDSPYAEFAKWIADHGEIEELPDGSFKESGTNIRTALLWAKVCDECRTGACWNR
jgi:hypothetical protein